MIISRTPFRLSFFGGGTDYPAWYLDEGGAVLSTTIDKYCYLSVRFLPPFFANKHRIVWSHVETPQTIAEILHPAVREGLRLLGFDDATGIEVHHMADLPARAGMGSSSSFAVGLIKALMALQGNMIGKQALALKAIELEQAQLRDNVGSQDQVAAAFGGLNYVTFARSGEIRVDPVTIGAPRIEELERNLLLFFTGTSRMASEVAADVIANLRTKRKALVRMRAMVDEGLAILDSTQSFDTFGRLMHEGWTLKRELSTKVETPVVDDVYRRALKAGAVGGKLLGAGGSGFMCFFVPPNKQQAVIRALHGYLHVPFRFESEGSKVIYYGPQVETGQGSGMPARLTLARRRANGVTTAAERA